MFRKLFNISGPQFSCVKETIAPTSWAVLGLNVIILKEHIRQHLVQSNNSGILHGGKIRAAADLFICLRNIDPLLVMGQALY